MLRFPREEQLLTPLWPERGVSSWPMAQLGWGRLAGVLSPFPQGQLLWLGFHLVFREPLLCPMGQCITREQLWILQQIEICPPAPRRLGVPTGAPPLLVGTLVPGSASSLGRLVQSDSLCNHPRAALQPAPRGKAGELGRGQAPKLGKGRPAPLLKLCISPCHTISHSHHSSLP